MDLSLIRSRVVSYHGAFVDHATNDNVALCNSERVREKNSIMGNNVLHNNIF